MKKYSFINPDYTLQNNLMAFGYECGEGWIPLIEETFDKIEEILKENPDLDFQVVQVKEKFGTLRIYYFGEGRNEQIDTLIDICIDKCDKICEACGEKGELREKRYWYITLCDKHYEEWIKK